MDQNQEAEAVVDDLIEAAQKAMVLRAFVVLEIADHLGSTELTLAELSAAVAAPEQPTLRLLRAAKALGLCRETRSGFFGLTPAGYLLRTGAPGNAAGWAELMTAPWMMRVWETLGTAVRTGRAQFPHVHGIGFWEYVASHPDEAAVFDAAMTSSARARGQDLHAALDWTHVGEVVDVGGGQGLLLASLLSDVPHLRGVVVDRPEVVSSSPQQDRGVSDRLTFIAGDFFTGVPAGADVYVLSRILHDWPDRESVAILRSCRRAMEPAARLLVLEQLTPDLADSQADEQIDFALKDLNMLVLVGGQERTASGYTALLHEADLALDQVHHGIGCDVLIAVPVTS